MISKTIVATALFTLSLLLLPPTAAAQEVEASANLGWTREYLYRGFPRRPPPPARASTWKSGGLYLGSWVADVGDGAEIDLYGGFGVELGGFSVRAGGIGYFYTGGFDASYLEANLTTPSWNKLSNRFIHLLRKRDSGTSGRKSWIDVISCCGEWASWPEPAWSAGC